MRGIILHAIRISLGAVFLTTSTVSAANMVPWVQDINTARQIAAARNQLILVHFFSDNCPPCRQLEANVFSQPGFGHGLARSYVPVQINVSVSPDLARQFRVDRWPMDVVITATGQEIHRMVSPQDSNEYLRILNQVAWRASSAPNGMDIQLATRGFVDDQPRSAVSSVSASQPQLGEQPGEQNTGHVVPMTATLPRTENVGPYFSPAVSDGISVGQPIANPVANGFAQQQSDSYFRQAEVNGQPQIIVNQFTQSAAATTTPPNAARASEPTLAASAQTVIPPTAAPPAAAKPTHKIGMEGYCPVTMIEEDRWVLGDKRWGAHHRGRVYVFHSAAAQQKFMAQPDLYSPALTGFDPVVFAEQGRYSEGMRTHGLRYHDQIFLFESEETLSRFSQAPDRFAEIVRLAIGANRKIR